MDVIWQLDLDLVITYINPAVEQVIGYTPEELIGTRLEGLCDKVNFMKMTQMISEAISKGPGGLGTTMEAFLLNKKRQPVEVEIRGKTIFGKDGLPIALQGVARDITEHKRLEQEKNDLIVELKKALSEVKKLSGFLPICASCKKIRNDKGYWQQVEEYISDHSEALFSHSICPDCLRKLYPEEADEILGRLEKDEKK